MGSVPGVPNPRGGNRPSLRHLKNPLSDTKWNVLDPDKEECLQLATPTTVCLSLLQVLLGPKNRYEM